MEETKAEERETKAEERETKAEERETKVTREEKSIKQRETEITSHYIFFFFFFLSSQSINVKINSCICAFHSYQRRAANHRCCDIRHVKCECSVNCWLWYAKWVADNEVCSIGLCCFSREWKVFLHFGISEERKISRESSSESKRYNVIICYVMLHWWCNSARVGGKEESGGDKQNGNIGWEWSVSG